MVSPISYFDFETKQGLEDYCRKAYANVKLFEKIFETSAENLKNDGFKIPDKNKELMEIIAKITGLSSKTVEGVNCADEALDLNGGLALGCTAVTKDGCVGQTLDLFTVELSLVRESDCLYITMPPYLCLMGMNHNLAFCTNYVGGKVQSGVSVGNLRRNILRQQSVNDASGYLTLVEKTSPANFLLCDREIAADVESIPNEMKIYMKKCFVHTNHILTRDALENEDTSTENNNYTLSTESRLCRAAHLLKKSASIMDILDDKGIKIPIMPVEEGIGFGSIVQVIMDVHKKELKYKDAYLIEYKTMAV